MASKDGGGFGEGGFDCVRKVWASSFDALSVTAPLAVVEFADTESFFTVSATEFPIHGKIKDD